MFCLGSGRVRTIKPVSIWAIPFSMELGTIHLRRRKIFTIFDPYPPSVVSFFTAIHWHFWPIFTVVDIICPPVWDRVNCLAKNWGGDSFPACESPALIRQKSSNLTMLFMNNPNKLICAKREERTKRGISSENVIFRFFRKKWKSCVGRATAKKKKRRDASLAVWGKASEETFSFSSLLWIFPQ